MPFKPGTSKSTATFNKYGLHLRWPRAWIIILGLILLFLCLCIAGMEVGHTIFDVYRSTAFGGFILFIPLVICAIFVLITACKPRLLILRIAVVLCCIMIILCMVLIAYDILVLIDPTRCFFLNCNDAGVTVSNTTYNATVYGWPLYITWPSYFQTNMNAKRIFQGIQILCAGLFILFASLYLLTYYIYRHIKLSQQTMYNPDRRTFTNHDNNRTYANHDNNQASPVRHSNNISQSYPQYQPQRKVTTYQIVGQPYTSIQSSYLPPTQPVTTTISPRKTKSKTFIRPRANSLDYQRLCTRCNREPRMTLTTNYERQNYFTHLCYNCNVDLFNDRRKIPYGQSRNNPAWRP